VSVTRVTLVLQSGGALPVRMKLLTGKSWLAQNPDSAQMAGTGVLSAHSKGSKCGD